MTELEKLATDAVAKVGRLTDDKVKLVKLLEESVENTRQALGMADDLKKQVKELLELAKKLGEERDMHKELRNIDSHRMKIATNTIEELEAELKPNWETV
jgi:hypothetical protein